MRFRRTAFPLNQFVRANVLCRPRAPLPLGIECVSVRPLLHPFFYGIHFTYSTYRSACAHCNVRFSEVLSYLESTFQACRDDHLTIAGAKL